MATATKTVNPLHFEDLEPHRFEDLIRQLIYDFREWRSLEATGRKGSDDGFDARGWEITHALPNTSDEDIEEGSIGETEEVDRIWLLQCKREKTITPKKLVGYLEDLNEEEVSELHGIIFVAACDFSKKTRDEFREWCRANNIIEFYLWGCAELEDMLFQPHYDHLLFAYFGISLTIRKRSSRTRLRSILATKRKAITHLGGIGRSTSDSVLLRDPDAHEYPYSGEIEDFDEHPKWRMYHFIGHYHSGLKFLIRRHFAYLNPKTNKWDFEVRIKTSKHLNDPWAVQEEENLELKVRNYWNNLPEENRVTLEIIGHIPYDDIIAIDEHGDSWCRHPHIYAYFERGKGPFSGGAYGILLELNKVGKKISANLEDRHSYFPKDYPDVEGKVEIKNTGDYIP